MTRLGLLTPSFLYSTVWLVLLWLELTLSLAGIAVLILFIEDGVNPELDLDMSRFRKK